MGPVRYAYILCSVRRKSKIKENDLFSCALQHRVYFKEIYNTFLSLVSVWVLFCNSTGVKYVES